MNIYLFVFQVEIQDDTLFVFILTSRVYLKALLACKKYFLNWPKKNQQSPALSPNKTTFINMSSIVHTHGAGHQMLDRMLYCICGWACDVPPRVTLPWRNRPWKMRRRMLGLLTCSSSQPANHSIYSAGYTSFYSSCLKRFQSYDEAKSGEVSQGIRWGYIYIFFFYRRHQG